MTLSTVKSNLWKLQARKKITKNESSIVKSNLQKLQVIKKYKKWKKSTKIAYHYTGFFVVKQPPACDFMNVMFISYV